jgi:hypothetical protein
MGHRRSDSGNRLSTEDHREIQRRVTEGKTFARAAAAVGCSTRSIQRFMARTGGLFPKVRERPPLRLSPGDREEALPGLAGRRVLPGNRGVAGEVPLDDFTRGVG